MNVNEVARIASLVGEPSRTAMLIELMGGRALTAHELAKAAHILAPAASRHLALLVEGGLLVARSHGRHRYHRIASPEVARVLEGIMQLAVQQRGTRRGVVTGPKEAAMRRARTCYDHVAGRLGVAIAERLIEDGSIAFEGESGRIDDAARSSLARLGIDLDAPAASLRSSARLGCRPCLDWSERSFHVGGALGALICRHCLDQRWLLRRTGSRALDVTAPGELALRHWLGPARWSRVRGAAVPA